MKRLLLISLVAAVLTPLRADSSALENRVAILEQEVTALRLENQKLRDSAVELLSAEIAKKETERARFVYRTQVVPMVKRLASDLGGTVPSLPPEEDIQTMVDAYRPFVELIASLSTAASGN